MFDKEQIKEIDRHLAELNRRYFRRSVEFNSPWHKVDKSVFKHPIRNHIEKFTVPEPMQPPVELENIPDEYDEFTAILNDMGAMS